MKGPLPQRAAATIVCGPSNPAPSFSLSQWRQEQHWLENGPGFEQEQLETADFVLFPTSNLLVLLVKIVPWRCFGDPLPEFQLRVIPSPGQ